MTQIVIREIDALKEARSGRSESPLIPLLKKGEMRSKGNGKGGKQIHWLLWRLRLFLNHRFH